MATTSEAKSPLVVMALSKGKAKDDEQDDDDKTDDPKTTAARDVLQAIKDDDAEALSDALSAHMELCHDKEGADS